MIEYNHERCSNNIKSIEMLEKKIGDIMLTLHSLELMNQRYSDFITQYEKHQNIRRNETRWIIGLLIPTVLGITGLLIRMFI